MMRPEIELGSGKLQKAFDALLAWTDYNKPIPGRGVKTSQAPNGIAINASVSAAAIAAALPWAPTITIPESGPATVTINPGNLFDEFGYTLLTIDGIDAAVSVVDTSVAFLQGEYTSTGPIGSDPYTLEVATAPTMNANWEVEFDVETGPPDITYQKYWRVPICKIESVESVLTITEIYAFNHLQLTRLLWQGKSALIPQARK
jgi:hypothetical protein